MIACAIPHLAPSAFGFRLRSPLVFLAPLSRRLAVPSAAHATSRPSERPRSRAVRPELASHDVSLVREPGELGHLPSHLAVRHLPPRLAARLLSRASLESLARLLRAALQIHEGSRMMLQGAQRCFALDLPGPRGAGPGGDPGPFDRCLLLTDSVFRDDSPSLDTRRIAFPTRYGSPRFTPPWLTSAIRPTCRRVFFSERRPAGVPLMPRRPAGFPGGAMSTGVGPRSPKRPRVEPDGLDRVRRAT